MGKDSQRKWRFCWTSKDEQDVHGGKKEEQQLPGWEQHAQKKREARTVYVVLLPGATRVGKDG